MPDAPALPLAANDPYAPPPRHSAVAADAPDASLAALVSLARRRWRWIVAGALLLAVPRAVLILIQPRTYTTSASFIPQARKQAPGLSGIAAQFGLALPASDGAQSPQFYADLVQSRELLGALAESTYTTGGATTRRTGRIATFYEIETNDPVLRRELSIRKLGELVQATAVQRTGVVNLRIQSIDAEVSRQLAERVLEQLDAFNQRTRQTAAAAERRFTERMVGDARANLSVAEARLQDFLNHNRTYESSPDLIFQKQRLERDVDMRQSVYTSLAQALDQARIDEVRDTPVITVVEQPQRAALPDPRGLVVKTILSAIIGGVLAVLAVLVREHFATHAPVDGDAARNGQGA